MRNLCDVYTEYKKYYNRELPEFKRKEIVRFLIRLLDEKKAFYVTVSEPDFDDAEEFITDMPKREIKSLSGMSYRDAVDYIEKKGYCVVEEDFLFEIDFIDESISMRKELPVTIVI